MISDHINDIRNAVKSHPNSLWRNKTMSHLDNALATVTMMELEDAKYLPPTSSGPLTTAQASANAARFADAARHVGGSITDLNKIQPGTMGCTCPGDGVTAKDCPVHSR